MARPDFTLKWAGSRVSIPAISAGNYAAGWDTYLGPLPPLGDDHDYVMNLQDSRAIWLGEQMLLAVGHEWQDDVTYDAYAIVRSPVDGQLYRSLAGGNLGNEPSVSGAQWALGIVQQETGLPSGYFSGFVLANDGGAPNTTISVGAGVARDSTNANNIDLTSALRGILQSSGAWAAGDNQNKLDTGAKAINTWYHVFAIRKTSDGTADILFSLSPTAPTMPSGYAGFRRISSIRTDASGNILGFINVGNRFVYKTPIVDMATAPITVRAPYVMKVPTGVRVLAQIGIQGAGGDYLYWIAETDGGAIPSSMYYGVLTSIGDDRGGQAHYVMTNTSGQVLLETGVSVTTFNVSALGWTELRG